MASIEKIASKAVEACLLEASSPKPGNVYPGREFKHTSYSDFTAGSNALEPVFLEAAFRGSLVAEGVIGFNEIGVGFLIRKGVEAVKNSHNGGNTHLGILLLMVPLCAAAGYCIKEDKSLKTVARKVVLGTTVQDSLDFYDAVNTAGAGGLGKSKLDVKNKNSKIELLNKKITLLELMKISSTKDMIANEFAENYPLVFKNVVPNLQKNMKKTTQKKSIVQTFLESLSKNPDTLIERKVGLRKAKEVSLKAKEVLKAGGVYSKEGRKQIKELDDYLRTDGNKLNPGSTADLIAAGLFITLL